MPEVAQAAYGLFFLGLKPWGTAARPAPRSVLVGRKFSDGIALFNWSAGSFSIEH
jgi:hypothetical protein